MADKRAQSLPSMQLSSLDWMLAGSTVALGIVLIAAPVALTPSLSSLYGMYGALEARSTFSRLMMSPWLPPLMAVVPMVVAIYSTVTYLTPWRRRAVLVVTLLLALFAAALFVQGLVSPIFAIADGVQ